MASEGSVPRHIVRQSTLEEASRAYPTSILDSTGNGILTPNGKPYPFFVPCTVKSTLGSPTALAIGAFSTTLTTLSFALMEWRGLSTTNVFIGNFFFVAGIGMVISAQWELILGNSFGYTALSAFGFFYGGFGAILTPFFGVTAAYGNDTAEYNNALGFFVLMWTVLNTFFLIGSLPINLVYIGIFFFVELAFGLVSASYFARADGLTDTATALAKAAGAFAFMAGLLGYYTVAHLMCQTACQFSFPMGDTSRFFVGKNDPAKGVQEIESAKGLGTKGDE
ncbi:related to Y.lipolytica GPR1 protein and Fun34p [Rhynchosporium secalis]|uniref:Related to Y.lipolytica GPR1 protein and Fun34p n=1 Tax=Rhynchosporium secalis TaxID=38038 RepID=A0A1E1MVA3_RHYSE|nr:related to Y.lipolytica GPR1 protein and Fun34p [Rhynchosporium secalis]